MMMRNGRLSEYWTHEYTIRSYNIVWNGLDLTKIIHGILPPTSLGHHTDSKYSMWITWTDLDHRKDLRIGYKHGRMVKMMLMITQMMNTPKTEGSLGLKEGVMSWHSCCLSFEWFDRLPSLEVFLSLSGIRWECTKHFSAPIPLPLSFSFLLYA